MHNKSFGNQPKQKPSNLIAKNIIAKNIKIWQQSIQYLSQFLMPTYMQSKKTNINDFHKTETETDTQRNEKLSKEKPTNQLKMNQQNNSKAHHKDSRKDSHSLRDAISGVNRYSQRFVNKTLGRMIEKQKNRQSVLFGVMDEWQQFTAAAMTNSTIHLFEQQTNLWYQQVQLLQNMLLEVLGGEAEPIITPKKGDKRFRDEGWSNNPFFDYLKQSYLLNAESILTTIDVVEGIDEKTRQRLAFFTRQWLNAIAPNNFLLTNPELLRLTKDKKGKNLLLGSKQLIEDMRQSARLLNIRMTDTTAFELGENIATTEGKVVFRNRMFELIQYAPTTATVNKRPLVIIPPWINKFYILDLKEENSFIRWALAEGHSVFVISWVNPNRAYKDVGMEAYMREGLLTALDVVKEITGEPNANVIGYCIGGMLLALTLSWLNENNQAERIASATFWTTLFEFQDPGDLGVFIDERIVSALEREGEKKGVFDGRLMGVAFSLLRENSLYWNYYIQNYLKGERPTPFDLLYWNSDCTNVTAALHSFVLRELYLGDKLIQKGMLEFDNIKIDLSKVTTPSYVVATLQDHIVKWKGSYKSTQALGGNVTFVLGESGHVAGIINPPTGKYGYYTHDDYSEDPDEWFEKAEKRDESWWLHWGDWIKNHTAGEVKGRKVGEDYKGNQWQVLCDAPGEYVRVRADEALKL